MFFEIIISSRRILMQHFFVPDLSRTFSESPVVRHENIIAASRKIRGNLSPAAQASRIPVKIEDRSFGLFYFEVQYVDSRTLDKPGQFIKAARKGVLEIGRENFGIEDQIFLIEIHETATQQTNDDNGKNG